MFEVILVIIQGWSSKGPPLSPTLSKPQEEVSLSSSFVELKFDHKFGYPFDEQAFMQNFETFQNIFTPFKPNLTKTLSGDFELFWTLENLGQTKA